MSKQASGSKSLNRIQYATTMKALADSYFDDPSQHVKITPVKSYEEYLESEDTATQLPNLSAKQVKTVAGKTPDSG